jgi:hypothetical protein
VTRPAATARLTRTRTHRIIKKEEEEKEQVQEIEAKARQKETEQLAKEEAKKAKEDSKADAAAERDRIKLVEAAKKAATSTISKTEKVFGAMQVTKGNMYFAGTAEAVQKPWKSFYGELKKFRERAKTVIDEKRCIYDAPKDLQTTISKASQTDALAVVICYSFIHFLPCMKFVKIKNLFRHSRFHRSNILKNK